MNFKFHEYPGPVRTLEIYKHRSNAYTDPRMSESLSRSDTSSWVDSQHTVDEILGFRRHRVPLR